LKKSRRSNKKDSSGQNIGKENGWRRLPPGEPVAKKAGGALRR